jgi:capsular exopolysaccharide synthesis family protein
MASDWETKGTPDWLRPAGEQAGLGYYVEVIRERIGVLIAIVVTTVAAAAVYLLTADDVYQGEASVLISPASADDPLLSSLGVFRESNDPTRVVETAATLATSLNVAERARESLGSRESAEALQNRVEAEPLASSDLVLITAEAPSGREAAELANAFADGLVEDRTDSFHAEIDAVLPTLEGQLSEDPGQAGLTPDRTLSSDIARLEALRQVPDNTVRVEERATPAASPSFPRPMLTIAGALIAGTILGIAGAFAVQTLDPRLRREEQLRSRYRLPILARIPRELGRKNRPLGPAALSLPTKEAYRTLRANITAARRDSQAPHSILITGSSPSEGKTTTAINLAGSLALAGNNVILIEADLRRPAIADALGIKVRTGVVSTMLENTTIDEALITTPALGPSLQLLLADYKGGWMSELFSLHAAQRLLDQAKERAEFVIVDSPPLNTVVDTLPLARQVDQVVIVTRLGHTRLDKLPELAELLASNGIAPLGFALVGTERGESDYYHDDANALPPEHFGEELPSAPPASAAADGEAPAPDEAPTRATTRRARS